MFCDFRPWPQTYLQPRGEVFMAEPTNPYTKPQKTRHSPAKRFSSALARQSSARTYLSDVAMAFQASLTCRTVLQGAR
jgi:hypothetical protein